MLAAFGKTASEDGAGLPEAPGRRVTNQSHASPHGYKGITSLHDIGLGGRPGGARLSVLPMGGVGGGAGGGAASGAAASARVSVVSRAGVKGSLRVCLR